MRPFLAVLFFIATTPLWAALSVTSSDTKILLSQQFRVEIELDRASESTPDLSQLSQDFSVLGFERMLLGQANRDHTAYRTRWYLSLKPRTTGELIIPSLNIDGFISAPVQIRVLSAPDQPEISASQRLSSTPYYPNQPILIDAMLVHPAKLPTGALLKPSIPANIQLRALTELSSNQTDEGWISKQRFAIFLDTPGTQATPKFELLTPSGELLTELSSEVIEILPPAYQTGKGGWLPAERLTLEDSWSSLRRLDSASSLTRTLTLSAAGPLAVELPELPLPEGFRRINTDLLETQDPFGIISTRIETWEISTANQLTLQTDSTEFPWWDIQSQQTRVLTIPARSLMFQPLESLPDIPEIDPLLTNVQVVALAIFSGISLLAALGFGVSLNSKNRRLLARSARLSDQLSQTKFDLEEHRTFLALIQACERNQAEVTAKLLMQWSAYLWPELDPDSLDSICIHSDDAQFNLALFQLIDHLDHPEEADWDGEALATLLRSVRRRNLTHLTQESSLGNMNERAQTS